MHMCVFGVKRVREEMNFYVAHFILATGILGTVQCAYTIYVLPEKFHP